MSSRGLSLALGVALVALAWGCESPAVRPEIASSDPLDALHHVRWSGRVGQGGEPKDDADFQALAAAGYRVLLSVDGAATDVEAAADHGLRYVHVPIGYDGVERAQALAIVKAVSEAEGPVYVHCHHGRHRGPAAAALARLAVDRVSREQALADLQRTLSPAYPGLLRDVQGFDAPGPDELAGVGALASRVQPSDLVAWMLEIDDRWGHLREARAAGWQDDPAHPDRALVDEARLLVEALTEAGRLAAPELDAWGPEFPPRLTEARASAAALEQALRARRLAEADAAADGIAAACTACHHRLRD